MSPVAQMTRTALPAPRNVESFTGGPRCPHDGRVLLLIAGRLVCRDCEASWDARGLRGQWSAQPVRVARRVAPVAALVAAAVCAAVFGSVLAAELVVVAAVLLLIAARGRGGRL